VELGEPLLSSFLGDTWIGEEAAAGAIEEGLEGLVSAGGLDGWGQQVVDEVFDLVEG